MRIRIEFDQPFAFSTTIQVRIGDINYGGHVGNDSILSLIHEARMQYLTQWGFTEMNAGGCGLIMADAAIQYKGEAFYGDPITVSIYASNLQKVSFDLFYKLSADRSNAVADIAFAKTGMVCFDYTSRTVTPIPDHLRVRLSE
jgi:acyl-CoA thioester hydrolase